MSRAHTFQITIAAQRIVPFGWHTGILAAVQRVRQHA